MQSFVQQYWRNSLLVQIPCSHLPEVPVFEQKVTKHEVRSKTNCDQTIPNEYPGSMYMLVGYVRKHVLEIVKPG